MADKNHPYAVKCLHYHGFSTRSDVTSKFIGHDKKEDIGRADIFAATGGRAVHIEVKRGLDAFALDDWRENQRDYARWTMAYPFEIPYWLFFTMGKHAPHFNEAKGYTPRISWLIPFAVFISADAKIRPYQRSLVYRVKKGIKKEIQAQSLDAITLFAGYELTWQSASALVKPVWCMSKEERELGGVIKYGGFWTIPERHPFYKEFDLGRFPLEAPAVEFLKIHQDDKAGM